MAWQSKYGAQFTKPLVRQFLAIINRDIQAALDDVSGAPGSLPPFVEYHIAFKPVKQFPAILFDPQAVKFDAGHQATRTYETRIYCAVAVAHQTPSVVAEMLEDYVRAVDEVIVTAFELTVGDFYDATIPLPASLYPAGTLSPGLPSASLKRVFIEGHAYDELRQTPKGFAKAATTSILCLMVET